MTLIIIILKFPYTCMYIWWDSSLYTKLIWLSFFDTNFYDSCTLYLMYSPNYSLCQQQQCKCLNYFYFFYGFLNLCTLALKIYFIVLLNICYLLGVHNISRGEPSPRHHYLHTLSEWFWGNAFVNTDSTGIQWVQMNKQNWRECLFTFWRRCVE